MAKHDFESFRVALAELKKMPEHDAATASFEFLESVWLWKRVNSLTSAEFAKRAGMTKKEFEQLSAADVLTLEQAARLARACGKKIKFIMT